MKTKRSIQVSGAFLIVAALALIALTGCQVYLGVPSPTPEQPTPGQLAPVQPQPGQPQPGQPMPEQPQPGQPQPGLPQPGQPQPGLPQPGQPQPGQPQPGQPQPGQPQPGQPPSGGQAGEAQISFTADRNYLNPGECATLTWNVQGQGNFWIEMDAQPVDRVGQKQVCPHETLPYVLHVDTGNAEKRQEIVITVGTGGGTQPATGSSSQSGTGNSSQPGTGNSSSSGTGCAGAPVIPSFTANPSTISAGQSSTLSWGNVTNGTTGPLVRSVVINPGLGEVGSGASSRQVKPNTTTTYTLTATGCGGTATKQVTVTVGSQPVSTVTMAPIPMQKMNLDLAVDNIYPASTGHIMATLKNAGNVNISGSYKLTCSGSYTDSGGNHALALSGQYAAVNLTPGQKADFDTSYSRNPSITEMWVSCTIIPPAGDSNNGNDSMGMTKVK